MGWALLITVAVVAVSGLALMFFVPAFRKDVDWHISWLEFAAGMVVACLVLTPLVFLIGKALATADALRYEEFYNGVETATTMSVEPCSPGSSGFDESSGHSNCDYEYQTGETYTYEETYYVEVCTTDMDGEEDCHDERRTRTETAYIYNPYANNEYAYEITDSLGGTHRFPGVYVKDGEGYGGGAIPAEIPRGDPAEWLEAKQRLEEGNPRPVTRLFDYNNYILASEDDMLVPYSEDVERYLEEEILPDHTANILTNPLYGFNASYADKVSFVGVEVANEAAWQDAAMAFNAALGSKYRGDLHMVIIDESLVDSPTDYLNALKAYWLSDDFGRRAIAKNAIIVVAGVDNGVVEWGIASTGMPFGNEVMLRGIQNFLPDTPLDPIQVIGAPRTVVIPATGDGDDEVQVKLSESQGVLERVILQDFPFKRACMECTDDEGIGYADMVVEIEPKPWQWAIMIVIVGVLSLFYWLYVGFSDSINQLWRYLKRKLTQDETEANDEYVDDLYRTARKRRRLSDRSDRYNY